MTDIPEYVVLAIAMIAVAALCIVAVVGIDLWSGVQERRGHDTTALKSVRRLLLILSGVCAAIAFYHVVARR